jgi:hypothetical protein
MGAVLPPDVIPCFTIPPMMSRYPKSGLLAIDSLDFRAGKAGGESPDPIFDPWSD